MISLEDRPCLSRLVSHQFEVWPEHRRYLEKSFAERPRAVLDISEAVAAIVLRLAGELPGGLDELCADYRFMCEQLILPEEVFFRRYDRYRLTSFADAFRECYGNPELMSRYMRGVLLSNVFWDNHARAFAHFLNRFLPSLPENADYLEVGPGHGLFLSFAARRETIGTVSGWDVSPASIGTTRQSLECIGVERKVELVLQDIFAAGTDGGERQFNAIVLGEILEHLEDPASALRSVARRLRSGGLVWINVPVNSPAPDHIYLLRTPEEARELVQSAGLEVVDSAYFPMSGATIEMARRHKLSISCVFIGRQPR
jgi:2-polyprenyl-3-methyl-5-hydroxy-6-metoxy-1,4-benzoquinol methylase